MVVLHPAPVVVVVFTECTRIIPTSFVYSFVTRRRVWSRRRRRRRRRRRMCGLARRSSSRAVADGLKTSLPVHSSGPATVRSEQRAVRWVRRRHTRARTRVRARVRNARETNKSPVRALGRRRGRRDTRRHAREDAVERSSFVAW